MGGPRPGPTGPRPKNGTVCEFLSPDSCLFHPRPLTSIVSNHAMLCTIQGGMGTILGETETIKGGQTL